MSYLTLVIKGNVAQAAEAAAKRKIGIAFLNQLPTETVWKCGMQFESDVAAWFCESPLTAPFHPGTLLIYSHHDGDESKTTIDATTYQALKAKSAAFEQWRNGRLSYRVEDIPADVPQITNEERSAIEVYEFVNDPPEKYFLYIHAPQVNGREDTHYGATGTAVTWMGDKLGTVQFGREYRSPGFYGVQSVRVPISVYAINGRTYHGTYYKSSGNYARIKQAKERK